MNIRLSWLIRIIALTLIVMAASLTMADHSQQELPLPAADATSIDGYELVEGDLMMPVEVARGRATYDSHKWPNGVVPYVFHASVNTTNMNRTLAAMAEWESVSGLKFVARTNQSNYIEFFNSGSINGLPTGNWSYVGMIGGRQYISIYNWDYKYVIMHEIAHALSFWHEQSRPDRDQYVTIKWANITNGTESNFAISNNANTKGSYDFESIMHYDDYAFSKNGQRTIVVKPGYKAYQSMIGNLTHLSTKDAAGMKKIYPPEPVPGDVNSRAFALTVQDYTSATINTAPYTKSGNEPTPSCASLTDKTVWYKVTPTHDTALSIYAGGFDTVLAVYTGKPNEWKQHACSDNDFDGSTAEYVMVNAQAGTTYYIVVGGWAGANGNLTLQVYGYRNLVKNGDFQWSKTGWAVKNLPINRADDKVVCGINAKAAYGSKCAFQFKGGAGEASKITQNIAAKSLTGVTFSAGQTYTLWVSAAASDLGGIFNASVVVTYLDGSKQTLITLAPSIDTVQTFYTASGALSRSDVKKFTLVINHTSGTGSSKVWIDNVQLRGPANMPLRSEPVQPAFSGQTR